MKFTQNTTPMQGVLVPDLTETRRQLAILDPRPDAKFAFRACGDRCADICETRKYFGTLERGVRQSSTATNGKTCCPAGMLRERQVTAGCGAFIVINQTDGIAQTAAHVTAVRALFADCDDAASAARALRLAEKIPPGLIIESGGLDGGAAKLHAYWPVTGCPPGEFTTAQMLLVSRVGGDPAVKDLPRIMRLVGFWHMKGTPRQTRIIYANPGARYDYRDLIGRIRAEPQVCTVTASGSRGPRRPGVAGAHDDAPAHRLTDLVNANGGLLTPAVRQFLSEAVIRDATKSGNWHLSTRAVIARCQGEGWSRAETAAVVGEEIARRIKAGTLARESVIELSRRFDAMAGWFERTHGAADRVAFKAQMRQADALGPMPGHLTRRAGR